MRLSDTPKKIENRQAHCVELTHVTLAELSNGDHGVNDYYTSGATRGALVAVVGDLNSATTPTTKASLYMKGFLEPEWPWYPLSVDAGLSLVTPSAPTVKRRFMSDAKKTMPQARTINSRMVTVVPVADLAVQSHPINQYFLSGKSLYSFIIGADETDPDSANWTYVLYMATGHEDTSKWVDVSGGEITPAGGAMPGQGTLRSDRTHKLYSPTVTSLGIPVVLSADIANVAKPVNIYGKKEDAINIGVDDLAAPTTFDFFLSSGYNPDDLWYNLDGVSASVTPA